MQAGGRGFYGEDLIGGVMGAFYDCVRWREEGARRLELQKILEGNFNLVQSIGTLQSSEESIGAIS